MADLLRGHLVDRDPDLNVGAVRFPRPSAGQKRRIRPGMVTGAVVAGLRVLVIQAAQHLERRLERRERLHRLAELKGPALVRRPPIVLMYPVGNIDKRHAQRRTTRGRRQTRRAFHERGRGGSQAARERRLKERQRHRYADSTKKLAAAQRDAALVHKIGRGNSRLVFHGEGLAGNGDDGGGIEVSAECPLRNV